MTTAEPIETIALVPVKDFANAKGRLAETLSDTERAALAEAMLRDVVHAAADCPAIQRVALLGGADACRLAAERQVHWLDDRGEEDVNKALGLAAANLAAAGVTRLFVLPGDLPTVQSQDIDALLACHEHGLTIRPAHNDGGTNALVISPPDALAFCFGQDSARRHLAAALAAGLPAHEVSHEAFARDIDGPADLRWLCAQTTGAHTARWLRKYNTQGRAAKPAKTALRA